MALSVDLFGTLVEADRPGAPWDAVADALADREVTVPEDWEDAYRTAHREYEQGREAPLEEHVRLALASRDVDASEQAVRDGVLAAFDVPISVRPGAHEMVDAAGERGPVAVCSNCSVPGLVERTLDRAGLASEFDAVVTSVDCGWRKPHREIFDRTAAALGVPLSDLVHVGDDARTDGGAGRVGARTVLIDETSLATVASRLREGKL